MRTQPSIFSVISGDEYESWYEMATDFTTPASSASSFAPSLDPSSAEARALNEASLAEFGSYLKTVGEPYSQFAANRREPVPEQAGKAREGEPAGGAVRQTIAPVTAQPVSLEEVPEVRAGAAARCARARAARCERSPHPSRCRAARARAQVLFDENFRLEDPETFAFFSPEGTPASTMVLQERLTHYLDLVEVNLLHAVSTRSEDFYTALGSWQELTEEVKRGCEQIDRLRAHVGAIDQRLARTALRLPFLGRKRSNQLRLHKKLSLLATIRKAQPTIQALLLAEDFVGALELISSTQAVLRDELAGVRCFMHLDEQLAETAAMLSRLMTQVRSPRAEPARAARGRGSWLCLSACARGSWLCLSVLSPSPSQPRCRRTRARARVRARAWRAALAHARAARAAPTRRRSSCAPCCHVL